MRRATGSESGLSTVTARSAQLTSKSSVQHRSRAGCVAMYSSPSRKMTSAAPTGTRRDPIVTLSLPAAIRMSSPLGSSRASNTPAGESV